MTESHKQVQNLKKVQFSALDIGRILDESGGFKKRKEDMRKMRVNMYKVVNKKCYLMNLLDNFNKLNNLGCPIFT